MKTFVISLALPAMLALFFACKPTKFTAENFPDRQLRWGSGGGYTGKETMYALLENGQIFLRENTAGKFTETAGAKPKRAKALYNLAETLGLAKIEFEHPGNTYKFIEVLNGDSAHRISWGMKNNPVNPQIEGLFRQLNELVNK